MRYLPLIALLAAAACGRASDKSNAASNSAVNSSAQPAPAPAGARVDSVTGVGDKFNAMSTKTGDMVGTLHIAAMDVQPATKTQVGVTGKIRFKGELQLSGNYRPHYEYPEVKQACFYPAAADWKKVPRAKGDERAIWFCFSNQQEALHQLGPLGKEVPTTIVVDDYTTNLGLSNIWDTARLVRVISQANP